MLQKEAFCFDGSLTACTCSADGLTIDWIGTVASNKDARQFGAWCAVNLFQVANLVSVQPLLEDICIGLVTNGQEETVNLDIYQLLIGFALALD